MVRHGTTWIFACLDSRFFFVDRVLDACSGSLRNPSLDHVRGPFLDHLRGPVFARRSVSRRIQII